MQDLFFCDFLKDLIAFLANGTVDHLVTESTKSHTTGDLEKALLSPSCSPRILDLPVIDTILGTVSNNGNGMVVLVSIENQFHQSENE